MPVSGFRLMWIETRLCDVNMDGVVREVTDRCLRKCWNLCRRMVTGLR